MTVCVVTAGSLTAPGRRDDEAPTGMAGGGSG